MNPNTPPVFLMLAAAIGISMAAFGLITAEQNLPTNSMARVNDTVISRAQFEHFKRLINENSKTKKSDSAVLQRLVDEELLVQRGVEMNLLTLNSTVRGEMVAAVSARFKTQTPLLGPSEAELQSFYQENIDYFRSPDLFSVVVYKFEALATAAQTAERWQKGTLPDAGNKVLLPMGLLSAAKLGQYLGPNLTQAAQKLTLNDISTPVKNGAAYYLIKLTGEKKASLPTLEKAEQQVIALYQRQAQQTAFTDYLQWLNDRADIEVQP